MLFRHSCRSPICQMRLITRTTGSVYGTDSYRGGKLPAEPKDFQGRNTEKTRHRPVRRALFKRPVGVWVSLDKFE